MDEEKIKEVAIKALTIVEDIDEKFQAYAYIVVLHHMLEAMKLEYKSITPEIPSEKPELLKLSLAEIFGELKPKKYTDSAIIIAFYLFKYERMDKFNVAHIMEKFDDVRAPKSSNINQILNWLIKRGLLRKSSSINGKKGFEITQMGLEYVEKLFEEGIE